jgi:hypothetical protein
MHGVRAEDFRVDYNRCRPHRSHGMMTPTAVRTGWETAHEAAPASAELRRRYASAPFDAGGTPTLHEPTTHQLSLEVDPCTASGQPLQHFKATDKENSQHLGHGSARPGPGTNPEWNLDRPRAESRA